MEVNERETSESTVEDWIDKFRVLDLKECLKARKLKSSGTKVELQNRLRAAIALDPEREDEEDEESEEKEEELAKVNEEPRINLTFKDVEESLTTFSGDEGKNILKWFTEFEETAETCKWTDVQKLIYCKRLLRGSAKLFVTYEKCSKSWAILRKKLKEEFSPHVNSREVHRELARRKKLPNESFMEYFYKMLKISSQVEMDTESVLQYIICGIPDDEANKSVLYGAKDIREFRKKLNLYESMKRVENQFVKPKVGGKDKPFIKVRETSKADVSNSDKRCYNCGEKYHRAIECPLKDRGPKCFLCKEFGHIASKCSKKSEKPKCFSDYSGNKYYKTVKINNNKLIALLDTGSDLTLIQAREYVRIGAPKLIHEKITFAGIGAVENVTLGGSRVDLELDGEVFPVDIHVVPDKAMRYSLIIGTDFLSKVNLQLKTGWRVTLTSLPKKILSGVSFSVDAEDPEQNVVLPKLPVPSLEKTMEKYLRAVEPIVNESQFEYTKSLVEAFKAPDGLGHQLQKQLFQRQEEKDNWAYEWWLNDMYMNVQLPLPVNSNPGMVFPPRQFKDHKDMARFAAILIHGILNHKEVLDRKGLPIERATSREKGQPLCMAQYYRLLTSYRVPGITRDQLFSTLYQDDGSAEHVIIVHKNQLYSLLIKTGKHDNGVVKLSVDQITQELVKILEAPRTIRAVPVGLLTTQKRDIWAMNRESLKQEYQNVDHLETIEKCLAVFCLDEPLPESFNMPTPRNEKKEPYVGFKCGNRDETNMMHQMINGGGSLYNSANRWFDKTVQFIISKDGVCGLCYEHSPAEGIPVIQLVEDLLKLSDNYKPDKPEEDVPVPEEMTAKKLEWVIGAEIQKNIMDAAKSIDSLVEDLDFYVYRYTNYGKDFIKSCNCSPDAYLQMALQLAYYRLYGHLVATYESAGTRRFLLGRVDCIRSATMECLEWVQSMTEGGEEGEIPKKVTFSLVDDNKRRELFETAMKRQTEIMVDNILGQGIDIHLLGLRETAKETNGETPELFKDETYITANHFTLSTSQLATKSDLFMGYGPVVPDGYGASYNPRNDQIVFCISAWHSCAKTSAWRFAQSVGEALNSMQKLLAKKEIDLK